MAAALTLDLFRPSILDPVEHDEAGPVGRTRRPEPSSPRPAAFRREQPGRLPLGGEAQTAIDIYGLASGDEDRVRSNASDTGGGLTLDDLLVGVWEGLSAHRTVACPACGEAMAPRYGAGPAPVGGRCSSCRTTIS